MAILNERKKVNSWNKIIFFKSITIEDPHRFSPFIVARTAIEIKCDKVYD